MEFGHKIIAHLAIHMLEIYGACDQEPSVNGISDAVTGMCS
jgi:hypothetical protein